MQNNIYNDVADWCVKQGVSNSIEGNWIIDGKEIKEEFGKRLTDEEMEKVVEIIEGHKEVACATYIDSDETIDITFYTEYLRDMEVFNIFLTETLQRECEIEAPTMEDAVDLLEDKYSMGEISLDYGDIVDVEFSNCKQSKKEIRILDEIGKYQDKKLDAESVITNIENIITGD